MIDRGCLRRAMEKGTRIVYTTDRGKICPRCGWPERDCRCSSRSREAEQPVPPKIAVSLRTEKRAGDKSVTVVNGLPNNRAFLEAVTRELKRSCGTGGGFADGSIELQGDQRERLRELLAKKGWKVKG